MSARDGVTIIGAGLMGPGIAVCSSLAGHPTLLVDQTAELAASGLERAGHHLEQLCENQLIDRHQANAARALLGAKTELQEAVADSFLIIEAVSENLGLKQELFRSLDRLAPAGALITSNTSGLRISDIAKYAGHPERMATTHFWFPAHLVPLVEIVMGEKTAEATAARLHELLLRWNKAPVIVRKDLPGQLANRILQAVIREAVNIVQMGLATPEDVDTAIKMGMGIRFPAWGPLEHIDAVGLDLALSVQQNVLPGLDNEAQAPQYLRELVDQHSLGYKTGKGFYDWGAKDMQELVDKRDRFIIEALRILRSAGKPGPDGSDRSA